MEGNRPRREPRAGGGSFRQAAGQEHAQHPVPDQSFIGPFHGSDCLLGQVVSQAHGQIELALGYMDLLFAQEDTVARSQAGR